MIYTASVVYPNNETSTFDMDYYLKTHMPLVMESWKEHGLLGYTVKQFEPGLDGAAPKFSVQCDLAWESKKCVEEALKLPVTKEVFDDVPKFSNETPFFMLATQVGEAKR